MGTPAHQRTGGFADRLAEAPIAPAPAARNDVPAPAMLRRRGPRLHREVLRSIARAVDAMAVGIICLEGLKASGTGLLEATLVDLAPFVLLCALAIGALHAVGAWRFGEKRRGAGRLVRVANASGVALMAGALLLTQLLPGAPEAAVRMTALVLWGCILLVHAAYGTLVAHLDRSGQLRENIVIVGATPNARRLVARNGETCEVNIVGVFDDRLSRAPADVGGVPVLGDLDDLINWPDLPEVDRIVVTVTSDARERVRALIDRLRVLPQRVVLLLDLQGFDPETESLSQIARSPAAYVSGRPLDLQRAVIKRGADIVLASLLLMLFSPLLLATAIAIRLEGPGPVFFRQKRHGFNNQIIRVWKFRSMKPDRLSEERMVMQTFCGDVRVTRVGKVIRATSIDELPQLLNVLRGEMSLVGPRPHAVGMTTEQTEVHAIVGDYAHRHRVKPGITGWAQINGSRGPVHSKEEVRERVRLDLEYVNRASFWFDLYILALTAPCLLGDRLRSR